MRTSILALVVGLGAVIALPTMAQQQTVPNPQMQEEADKGAKTRQSGESGYVGEQEKPGASAHAPGRPADQPTTGSSSGTSRTSPSGTGEKSR
ncbi:hypothetical protein [Bradyrhizobium sp. Leo121]|uniref:hypothetical protein n=1 Tax=Bradyrhizobium sp. Leo121 TaxID=1571195 RepID=UPI00102A532E|nr:hypothetical protein [Bradyrhizobium sp. Leo121]